MKINFKKSIILFIHINSNREINNIKRIPNDESMNSFYDQKNLTSEQLFNLIDSYNQINLSIDDQKKFFDYILEYGFVFKKLKAEIAKNKKESEVKELNRYE